MIKGIKLRNLIEYAGFKCDLKYAKTMFVNRSCNNKYFSRLLRRLWTVTMLVKRVGYLTNMCR